MDCRSIVRALGRCRSLLLRTVLLMVLVASRHSARGSGGEGANRKNVPLDRVPLAGSTPLKGRQAEFYKYQSGRRSTANSEASPNQATAALPFTPPPRWTPVKGGPEKGVQNHWFWRVFGYFCRGAKVTAGSGGAEPPGGVKKQLPRRAKRGKDPPTPVLHH